MSSCVFYVYVVSLFLRSMSQTEIDIDYKFHHRRRRHDHHQIYSFIHLDTSKSNECESRMPEKQTPIVSKIKFCPLHHQPIVVGRLSVAVNLFS